MADPWPRETFVIPGSAGQVGRTINMIKIDDTFRTLLLAILNGDTTNQGPNPMPAIGPMGHTQGHVDFPINSINVGNQDNPNFVRFDDYNVRTSHVKALCARRGLKNDDTIQISQNSPPTIAIRNECVTRMHSMGVLLSGREPWDYYDPRVCVV